MSASSEFVAYVRELLNPLGVMKEGRFFGGHAFKLDGNQFAMIMGNTLYFRVDDVSRPLYETHGMLPFSYATNRGRVLVKKYYGVPNDVLEDRDTLLRWAREAVRSTANRLV